VASWIVTHAVLAFGSDTDLTSSLVDANRGECLWEEDPERALGVNIGLKLKSGSNGEKR